MILTISTEHSPATDLGFLLHKHPQRRHQVQLAFGQAHVFFPQVDEARCTAALLLDVDPVRLVRGRRGGRTLFHYVNDRPYVASSFMSVAIARVFGTALSGRSRERPQLASQAIPLQARLAALPCSGGEEALRRLFEPLGYAIDCCQHPLDPAFPQWGRSRVLSVGLTNRLRLSELLSHLYVLMPALDGGKHYWIGPDEIDKLLSKGKGWLAEHPHKDFIARRYLLDQRSLAREALQRLTGHDEGLEKSDYDEERIEKPLTLSQRRLAAVQAQLESSGARSVVDLGCGEGKLLRHLTRVRQFVRLAGMDVSATALERASRRLQLDRLGPKHRKRIELLLGSLTYSDTRLQGFDAAAAVEVVEHLDPSRLPAFEHTLFGSMRPRCIVMTTPNRDYNVLFESLSEGGLRHRDHRFEWTREEFRRWGRATAETWDYGVRFEPVGPVDEQYGPPTQMAVFERSEHEDRDA